MASGNRSVEMLAASSYPRRDAILPGGSVAALASVTLAMPVAVILAEAAVAAQAVVLRRLLRIARRAGGRRAALHVRELVDQPRGPAAHKCGRAEGAWCALGAG